MNDLNLTIIHLLHTMRVKPSAIFADDFVESFNLNLKNPSLNEKTQHLTFLKDDGYIQIDDNGYMGLTQQGGKFWEKHFLIDWQLYFEYGSQFIGDKEYVFFYAARQATIKLAMKHSKGLFDDGTIQTAQNWQPIYWKKPFNGFYIQKELNNELLPYFDDILPKYCKSLDFNAKFIGFK